MRPDVIDIVQVGYLALAGVAGALLVTAVVDAASSAELPVVEVAPIEFVQEENVNRETVDIDGNRSYLIPRPGRPLIRR